MMKKFHLLLFWLFALGLLGLNAQISNGIAIDPNTYAPNHVVNKTAPLVVDKNTGALLVTSGSSGSGGAVTMADGASQTIGAKADASASSDSGTFSVVSLLKRLLSKIPTVGQTTKSGSLPVTLASDQGSLPISGTVSVVNFPATQPISAVTLPLPSGASTSALQTTGNTSLSSIDGDLGISNDASALSGNGSIIALLKAIRDFKAPATFYTATITTTTETTVIPAVVGVRNVLKYALIQNLSTSNRVKIDIRGATAGTVIFSFELPANTGSSTALLPISVGDGVAQTAVNNNWTVTATGTSPNVFVHFSAKQINF